jgi:hypothetical protein
MGSSPSLPAGKEASQNPTQTSRTLASRQISGNWLTRQQKVEWAEFSWLSIPGNDDSRVYQRFATDISRLDYTDDGWVYSIICPVTGQRGWVNEPGQTVYADMGVKGRIWISESSKSLQIVRDIMKKFDTKKFPFSKANSVNVATHKSGSAVESHLQPLQRYRSKLPSTIDRPAFHEAYGVGYLNVEIGAIEKTGIDIVDKFNQLCWIFSISLRVTFASKAPLFSGTFGSKSPSWWVARSGPLARLD